MLENKSQVAFNLAHYTHGGAVYMFDTPLVFFLFFFFFVALKWFLIVTICFLLFLFFYTFFAAI